MEPEETPEQGPVMTAEERAGGAHPGLIIGRGPVACPPTGNP